MELNDNSKVFQVDTILKSAKELEKEKSDKETILLNLSNERSKLQKQLEEIQSKHTSVSGVHVSSVEQMKISEQRTIELERQIKLYEVINDEKRSIIEQLTQNVEQEDKTEQKGIHDFESTMTGLAHKFRTAVDFYSIPSLDKEIETAHSTKHILMEKSDNIIIEQNNLRELNKSLDDTVVCEEESTTPELIISENNQTILLSMYKDIIDHYKSLKDISVKKQQELLQHHNLLLDQLKNMTTVNK